MLQAMYGKNSPLSRLRQRQRVLVQDESSAESRLAGLTLDEERLLRQILSEPMDYIEARFG